MGQIRLIPGISHPRRDTLKRRPTMPRQRQTPCYSSPYRGSKGRWRRVDECVGEWRAGQEQQRAARTRRPFAYFTGNLRASIRQGNCKNGGVIYLSLPLWALSSFPRFPFPSALLLALTHVCRHIDTYIYLYICIPTYMYEVLGEKKRKYFYFFRIDKKDLFLRFESPLSPNCIILR